MMPLSCGESASTSADASTQWAILRIGTVAKSNAMSLCGFMSPSATMPAPVARVFMRGYSTEPTDTGITLIRSRMRSSRVG